MSPSRSGTFFRAELNAHASAVASANANASVRASTYKHFHLTHIHVHKCFRERSKQQSNRKAFECAEASPHSAWILVCSRSKGDDGNGKFTENLIWNPFAIRVYACVRASMERVVVVRHKQKFHLTEGLLRCCRCPQFLFGAKGVNIVLCEWSRGLEKKNFYQFLNQWE